MIDLDEDVVVIEHLGHAVGGRRGIPPQPLGNHTCRAKRALVPCMQYMMIINGLISTISVCCKTSKESNIMISFNQHAVKKQRDMIHGKCKGNWMVLLLENLSS
jgi:hypothetical protein